MTGNFKQLKRQIQYCLSVTDIEPAKPFKSKEGYDRYSFKVVFQDKFGYNYKGDFISNAPQQHIFVVGRPMTFRIVNETTNLLPPEILPLDQMQSQEKQIILSEAPPIHGTTYSQALLIASTMFNEAKKNSLTPLSPDDKFLISESDVANVLFAADMIDNWLLDKQMQRITDEVGL